ncbi:AbrB family transcriptional regulator, partial [Rhizobium leguminosarum]
MHKNNDLERQHESNSHLKTPRSQISQLTARLPPAYTGPAPAGSC